jgi:outer membrane protein assembly factor BamC
MSILLRVTLAAAWRVALAGLVAAGLTGCTVLVSGDGPVDYGASVPHVPTLEIPPDLTMPATDERYRVSPTGEASATYSSYSKGTLTQRSEMAAVLPELQTVRLEGDAARHWLVVADKPENVWATVKLFWQDLGLTIESEDQAAGVMQTAWAENRASIPRSSLRKFFGRLLSSIYSSNQIDQYLIRLQPAKEGAATEVHVTLRSKEEVFSADKSRSIWETRPVNPEVESAVLQRLMVRLGASEIQANTAVKAVQPAGVNVAVPLTIGSATLRETESGKNLIVINDAFDKAWRSVGLAIERANLAVEDRNRDQGIYFLRPLSVKQGTLDKLQFWKKQSNEQYRVHVQSNGATCEVTVTGQDAASNKTTRQILELIYKNIERP